MSGGVPALFGLDLQGIINGCYVYFYYLPHSVREFAILSHVCLRLRIISSVTSVFDTCDACAMQMATVDLGAGNLLGGTRPGLTAVLLSFITNLAATFSIGYKIWYFEFYCDM